jgi:hypothetical protein
MFLKGGLARYRTLSELPAMGDNLKKIWRAFKIDFPGPALSRHDRTISLLNRFEQLRYPNHYGPAVIEIDKHFSVETTSSHCARRGLSACPMPRGPIEARAR